MATEYRHYTVPSGGPFQVEVWKGGKYASVGVDLFRSGYVWSDDAGPELRRRIAEILDVERVSAGFAREGSCYSHVSRRGPLCYLRNGRTGLPRVGRELADDPADAFRDVALTEGMTQPYDDCA